MLPRDPRLQNEEDPCQRGPVRHPRTPRDLRRTDRQNRLDTSPQLVAQQRFSHDAGLRQPHNESYLLLGTLSLGFVSFGGEVCYVSTPGGSGIAATGSVTAGPGFGANVHAGGGASNACRPSEYGGPFAQAGGSAEGLVGGYGNAFTNAPVPGHGNMVVGATGGLTAGFGVEGGAGGSETAVLPLGGESSGGSCSC